MNEYSVTSRFWWSASVFSSLLNLLGKNAALVLSPHPIIFGKRLSETKKRVQIGCSRRELSNSPVDDWITKKLKLFLCDLVTASIKIEMEK